jgi:hypothetical protein
MRLHYRNALAAQANELGFRVSLGPDPTDPLALISHPDAVGVISVRYFVADGVPMAEVGQPADEVAFRLADDLDGVTREVGWRLFSPTWQRPHQAR